MSEHASTTTHEAAPSRHHEEENQRRWASFFDRALPGLAIAGPALFLVGALLAAARVQPLPGEMDWVSEPESFVGFVGTILLVVTWVEVGRRIARLSPRAGIAVTLLGVWGAFGAVSAFAWRQMSVDLVGQGADPDLVLAAWENPTLYSALTTAVVLPFFFLAPVIAGVAVLRSRAAPAWAGLAVIAFVPAFIAAQAAYLAFPVTYPAAAGLLLLGVIGIVRADAASPRRDR